MPKKRFFAESLMFEIYVKAKKPIGNNAQASQGCYSR
jgi:hypothetical protein